MGKQYTANVPSQRITPPEIFFNRRKFLSAFGVGILATPMAMCSSAGAAQRPQGSLIDVPLQRPDVFPAERNAAYDIPALIDRKDLTAREVAGSHTVRIP